jgi:hypothetical protein
LKPQQLLLLLEVGHNLAEPLLEQLYLRLQHLDLIVLLVLLPSELLHGLLLLTQIRIVLLVF